MIAYLALRFFHDTHPDLTPKQAVTWMRAEERLRCGRVEKVQA